MTVQPGFFKPMEPILHPQAFDSSDYIYQVKWDGVRMLAYISGTEVRLINKRMNERTLQYPELQQLAELVQGCPAVLDGELIVLRNGQSSFPSIIRRDLSRTRTSIAAVQRELPVDYMLFDILYYDGRDLTHLPLTDRKKVLTEAIKEGLPRIHIVEDFPEGKNLFAAVQAQDMEGIVAKRKTSRYLEGKKHREWLKIKYRRSLRCLAGGYTVNEQQQMNSLLLGLYQGDQLLYIGRASSGISPSEWEALSSVLPDLKTGQTPFADFPPPGSRSKPEYRFTEPVLTLQVEYAEWTDNRHLRSPSIKGFTSCPAEECTF